MTDKKPREAYRQDSIGLQQVKKGVFKTPFHTKYSIPGSLVEEDKMAQVMLSQTLTDILTAATMSGQDPAPWLLGSMMEECLTLARGFDTLVPEEFYLPAPPYYCPQPEYIPNVSPSHCIDKSGAYAGGGGGCSERLVM